MSDEDRNNPNYDERKTDAPPHEEAPRVRAVPNIPRREPDSLPERPERSGASGSKNTVFLLILAVIIILIFVFLLRK